MKLPPELGGRQGSDGTCPMICYGKTSPSPEIVDEWRKDMLDTIVLIYGEDWREGSDAAVCEQFRKDLVKACYIGWRRACPCDVCRANLILRELSDE